MTVKEKDAWERQKPELENAEDSCRTLDSIFTMEDRELPCLLGQCPF